MSADTQKVGFFRLPRELSAASWQRDVVSAMTALEVSGGLLTVECGELRSFDDDGLALLIGLSRYSERRQTRVVLSNAPEILRKNLDSRGLAWLFDWRADS